MAHEVREALQPLTNSHSVSPGGNFPGSSGRSGYGRDSPELPTCYRRSQKGHVRRGCRNPPIGSNSLEQLGKAMDLWCRAVRGSNTATAHPVLDTLIGEANECVAYLNGHPCLTLLDTGSQVTSVHLSDRPIQPLKWLVCVVRAAGQEKPYLGYVELSTVEPQFNEPLYNKVLDIMNDTLCHGQNYSKMYVIEPQYNGHNPEAKT